MQLPALKIQQNGRILYLASVQASLLKDREIFKVDHFDPKDLNDMGYQRLPSDTRAKDFARYLSSKKGLSPSAILLNVRSNIPFQIVNGRFGILNVEPETIFWIVDGQHRIEGIRELLDDEKYSSNNDLDIPVIIMQEANIYDEAMQFIIVNKTQKGVKPDLAERFLAKIAKTEPALDMDQLPRETTRDISWRPKAIDIVDLLNGKNSDEKTDDFYLNPWYQNIQLPNQVKGSTLVTQKAFEDSIKPVLNSDSFSVYTEGELSIILARYWQAIRQLMPQCFDLPKEFVVQKTTGINVFHKILPKVMSIISRKGERISIESITNILSQLGEMVTDIFWSSNGVAGQIGTSNKAVGIIVTKFTDSLDEIANETNNAIKPFTI